MIRLTRVRTAKAISSALRGKLRVKRNRLLLDVWAAGQIDAFSFKGKEFWKNAKEQLKLESNGKCAYCESPTSAVAHGDVEHFRPKKGGYWWLAYCYDNYTYACQICNQMFKGSAFPVAGAQLAPPAPPPTDVPPDEAVRDAIAARLTPDPLHDPEGQPVAEFEAALAAERALLLDPYRDDPAACFAWEADPDNRWVRLVAPAGDARAAAMVAAAEEVLGLNRDELRNLRWQTYEVARTLTQVLDAGLTPTLDRAIRDQLANMQHDRAAYAGMVRYFVAKWQGVP